MTKEKSFIVGNITTTISNMLPDIQQIDNSIYQSYGLEIHIQKRHPECTEYIDRIPEIISFPDYIGVNPNESVTSLELVKKYDNNIQIGIKLDIKEKYLYVATLHTITDAKLKNRINSGRLKKLTNTNTNIII